MKGLFINKWTGGFLLTVMSVFSASAQSVSKEIMEEMGQMIHQKVREQAQVGRVRVRSVDITKDSVKVIATDNLFDAPMRPALVEELYAGVRELLPEAEREKTLVLFSAGQAIENLIPYYYRESKGKKKDKKTLFFATPDKQVPLVSNASAPLSFKEGLQGRHIAMWQSHGWYYEAKLDRWEWQRARIFQTVEDLYTQSYVLPFLVPMLENAGAYVMLPRERDANPYEVIVDNDSREATVDAKAENATYRSQFKSRYTEVNGDEAWQKGEGEGGFAYRRQMYINHENPFNEGTYRQITTVKKGNESKAVWTPDLQASGEYAVYVSYRTLPKSTDDARYTVYHNGKSTTFRVNQQMGGGTWIYLGTFHFDAGCQDKNRIELSNLSSKKGLVVTADAVKIGGGMGNIGRYVDKDSQEEVSLITPEQAQVSGYPRFCEAARYWMQWAGVPDSIYDLSGSRNDYTDDYRNRGLWVNWLMGGSYCNPDEPGLNIPMDLSFAFHTDAGTTLDDRIIGTLAIYDSEHHDGKLPGGASRGLCRDLTDLVQTQIVSDIKAQCEPNWTRRQLWDKAYFEAWSPKVPAMLLELLSHQNFADMRYGLDPRFRFIVSRAIYKGMLKFLATQRKQAYVVQPLPVSHMTLTMSPEGEARLTWQPTADTLEPTAVSDRYIVYTRCGQEDWDNGQVVTLPEYSVKLQPGVIYSFKVVAANEGGLSFPSEILSAGLASGSAGQEKPVLVVNNFNRISAPADFKASAPADTSLAGFLDEVDHGVPYLRDISYIGTMKEYRRRIPWMDDDASGFGDSYADYETQVIAGNTFDYPAVHGAAILAAGRSFVSCSDESVKDSIISLNDYPMVDLILGKECQTKMGRGGVFPLEFKVFDADMQRRLTAYLRQGGRLFASGAFIGSDLWDSRVASSQESDRKFASEVLKYKWRVGQAARRGAIKCVKSSIIPRGTFTGDYRYFNELNSECYVVESPDAIEPADKAAATVMRFTENNLSVAVAYNGADYKTFIMSVPFETLTTPAQREQLMKQILGFLK